MMIAEFSRIDLAIVSRKSRAVRGSIGSMEAESDTPQPRPLLSSPLGFVHPTTGLE